MLNPPRPPSEEHADVASPAPARSLPLATWAMTGLLLVTAVLALFFPSSYGLTCLSDVVSCGLWAIAVAAMLRAALLNQGRIRIFWVAFAAGATLAGMNLGAWTYYDVIARRAVPDPFWADIPLFLQPIPMTAAVALQPHRRRESPKPYFGTLNFLILLLWWVYLYSFRIFPHEYIVFNPEEFNRYYNILYILEFLILLAVLGWSRLSTRGCWRQLYLHLFLATAGYTLVFQALNSALLRGTYYPGSLYDVFNNAATCYLIWIAVRFARLSNEEEPEPGPGIPDHQGLLGGRLSLRWSAVWSGLTALAVLSVPLAGMWTLLQVSEPPALQNFRLAVTLAASGVLGFCVFLRQRALDKRLIGLLATSEQTLENLQRVQGELVHKERVGSLGQLLAGAAHEINNPLTAILGYAELLASAPSASQQQSALASSIAQQARYARDLVTDLLSFARRTPGEKSLVDLVSLLQRAVQMESANPNRRQVQIIGKFPVRLPRVCGSTNELLQACLQLIGGIAGNLESVGGGTLLVRARSEEQNVLVEFSCLGPGGQPIPPGSSPCAAAANKDSGLRFRAAHSVVENHGGHLTAMDDAHLLLSLPAHVEAAASAGLSF